MAADLKLGVEVDQVAGLDLQQVAHCNCKTCCRYNSHFCLDIMDPDLGMARTVNFRVTTNYKEGTIFCFMYLKGDNLHLLYTFFTKNK